MEIFPAIDIMDGAAVRLTKGAFDTKKVYSDDPESVYAGFIAEGAEHLHIVDLDGARSGKSTNFEVVKRLAAMGGDTEIGGGIRDMRRAESYLNLGVSRIILGTAAVENPSFLKEALKEWGNRVAVGVDVLNGIVRVSGWERGSALDGEEFVKRLSGEGVKRIIYTDISRDGVMKGLDTELYGRLSRNKDSEIIASGGIGSLQNVKELLPTGVYGVIIGKAIYEKAFSVSEAVRLGDRNDN